MEAEMKIAELLPMKNKMAELLPPKSIPSHLDKTKQYTVANMQFIKKLKLIS